MTPRARRNSQRGISRSGRPSCELNQWRRKSAGDRSMGLDYIGFSSQLESGGRSRMRGASLNARQLGDVELVAGKFLGQSGKQGAGRLLVFVAQSGYGEQQASKGCQV